MITWGWVAVTMLGQWGFSAESLILQWAAVLWLCVGLLLVNRTWCLPLLILSVPVFMCENHRPWAWAQPLACWILLGRIMVEQRLSARQYVFIFLVAGLVFGLSCPMGAKGLLKEWLGFPREKWLGQWLGPGASWAVFPLRATVDRTAVAALATAVILSGRYFSSVRIWRALWLCAVLMLLANYIAWLMPPQHAHRFLGTSNFHAYGDRLLAGAGYNIHYFVAGLAAGLAFIFTPPRDNWRWMRLASIGLLPPTILIHQRGFSLFAMALPAVGLLVAILALSNGRGRRAVCRRWRQVSISRSLWATAGFVLMLGLSWACLSKMGLFQEGSLIRKQLGIRGQTFFTLNTYRASGVGVEPAAIPPLQSSVSLPPAQPDAQPSTASISGEAVIQVTGFQEARSPRVLFGRLEGILMRLDDIRARMWVLGIKESLRHHLWRGKGVGTWGRFHRKHPPPDGLYYAHMHNTYLDLMFEYGVVPMILLCLVSGIALFRLAMGWSGMSRLWLFYLVPLAVVALGQHLLFSFTSLVLLLPAFIVLARSFLGMWQKTDEAGV